MGKSKKPEVTTFKIHTYKITVKCPGSRAKVFKKRGTTTIVISVNEYSDPMWYLIGEDGITRTLEAPASQVLCEIVKSDEYLLEPEIIEKPTYAINDNVRVLPNGSKQPK